MKMVYVTVICLFIVGCSPVPLIQSPRITPGFSIGASMKYSGPHSDNSAEEMIRTKKTFIADERIPAVISIGIKDRIEISGMAAPYLWYGYLWTGNLKLKCIETGNGNFKNIASAIFVGSTGYYGEHEEMSNYYGGISASTMLHYLKSDIELVIQTSYAKEWKQAFELRDNYWIHWLQPAAGIIINPFENNWAYLSFGLNYSYPLKSTVNYYINFDFDSNEKKQLINSASGGFTFLGEIKVNLSRKNKK
jgi:hypothetical protein